MRTYYIFNVNKEMCTLTKDSPYMLFKSFESIYNSNKNDYVIASNLYEQLASKFNRNFVNQKIIESFKDNQHYMYVNNKHTYYNKYRDENCILTVKNSYLLVNSNTTKLLLLNSLSNYNFFVCDFQNKDYFWLNEIYC